MRNKNREPIWIMVLRVALALLFLFSGMTKAIDPINWGIKMDEYFNSFGITFLHQASFYIGFIPVIAEFLLGFMLLFRIQVRWTALGYLLFMVFFFFLTLWLAVAEHLEVNYGYNFGVVKDCGCFGQAIAMSNLETFLKNVVIIIPTIIIYLNYKKIPEMKASALGKFLLTCVGLAIVVAVQIYSLVFLPPVDYSNWRVGDQVVNTFIDMPAKKEMLFIYQNNADPNDQIRLTEEQMGSIMDEKPNFYEEYEYVDRIDSIVAPAIEAEISGFNMLDSMGRDHAPNYINPDQEKLFLLFIHNLDDTKSRAMKGKALQSLVAACQEAGIPFVAVTNDNYDEIVSFISKYQLTFPIYQNLIDPVKGPFMTRDAIRSNPGLILIEKGVVTKKWTWRRIPSTLTQ